jgi:hypothetical protein
MDNNEQCALDANGNLKDASDIAWAHSPSQMEHTLPSVRVEAAARPPPQSAFTSFQFAAPLNPGNINVATGNAAANLNTSGGQRKIIAGTSQIRQGQPVTAAKLKGKRPAVDRLLSESTSAAGSQANSAAASEKSDGESQVEEGHRRKRRKSAPGDGGKDVLTLFTAVDADDTNEGYTCAGCMYVVSYISPGLTY